MIPQDTFWTHHFKLSYRKLSKPDSLSSHTKAPPLKNIPDALFLNSENMRNSKTPQLFCDFNNMPSITAEFIASLKAEKATLQFEAKRIGRLSRCTLSVPELLSKQQGDETTGEH